MSTRHLEEPCLDSLSTALLEFVGSPVGGNDDDGPLLLAVERSIAEACEADRADLLVALGSESADRRCRLDAVWNALRSDTTCTVDARADTGDRAAEREALRGLGVAHALFVPLAGGGAIAITRGASEQPFTGDAVGVAERVAQLTASALVHWNAAREEARRRSRSEAALRESQLQLVQSQKMQAVGRLAGGIAHDFNNLLTVILGFSRSLLADLEDGSEARDDVVEINEAAQRAAALTRQLLTFSRRKTRTARLVNLNDTVDQLREMLARLLGDDVELVIAARASDASVDGDPNQLEQVLINLAVNARDAMADGGTLQIRTANRDIDAEQQRALGLESTGQHLVVSVTDSGCGMDDATRARIFEPFFTTKAAGKGTGLGLSIVYGIVEENGGSIRVSGGLDKGTTFEIYLPCASGQEAAAEGALLRDDSPANGCVLLVEDEPAVRRLSRRILERTGYRVLEASDGREGVEIAEAFDGEIDLVLSDVVMPRMGGPEMAARLRETRPDLRVLFMSGNPDRARQEDGPTLGSDALIAKPFTARALIEGLREVREGER